VPPPRLRTAHQARRNIQGTADRERARLQATGDRAHAGHAGERDSGSQLGVSAEHQPAAKGVHALDQVLARIEQAIGIEVVEDDPALLPAACRGA
jgi:hypothetical protein